MTFENYTWHLIFVPVNYLVLIATVMKFIHMLLLLSFLVTFSNTLAQDTSFYASGKRNTIYYEDFQNSDDSCWNSKHACYYGKVENGYYVYEVKKKQAIVRNFEVGIDTNKNFEIEIVINVLDRKSRRSWAILCWDRQRGKYTGNSYGFTVRENGYLAVHYGNPKGGNKTLYNTTAKIKINGYNKYTIQRQGESYLLFVNGIFTGSFPYTPLRNSTMGIGAGADNKLGVAIYDYVKVSDLD